MSYNWTGAWEVIDELQSVEETTYGQTPSSPAFSLFAHNTDIVENSENRAIDYRKIGSRDMYKALKTGELHSFQVRYSPHNTAALRLGSELPGGTGTNGVSRSFVKTQKIDVSGTLTKKWFRMLGARCDRLEMEISDAGFNVVQNFVCQDIPAEVAADPFTTPTYASADTTAPWTNISAGQDPFTVNSLVVDTPRIKWTVEHPMDLIRPNGYTKIKNCVPTNRIISVEFDTWKKDGVMKADMVSMTARAASYTIFSGKTISMTDLYLKRYSKSQKSTDNKAELETLGGTISSLTITA